ncbi:hypothetical protein E2C01_099829 [Portunus trituberculatus]|uniref:Uncharacterized protein n=1 Tax=Portunus trituberculatus TaxID=210409 RepID=A0A5B7KBE3_PORTR|nr:hypothetical protein [Portunus trituberculatus]
MKGKGISERGNEENREEKREIESERGKDGLRKAETGTLEMKNEIETEKEDDDDDNDDDS